MWTVNHTKKLIGILRLAILTLTWPVFLADALIQKLERQSKRKWETFLKSAGICARCLTHTAHIVLLMLFLSSPAQAEINPALAQKALIGEAANQGLKGMIACGEVIRRRGNLKGIYGLKRESFISAQPKWVHQMAKKAWQESSKTNLTKGATHWENVKAFGRPKWAKKMKKTAVIGDHVFYAEVSK